LAELRDFAMLQSVSTDYVHGSKTVTPRPRFEAYGGQFKWYDVSTAEKPVPEAIGSKARDFLSRTDLDGASELGFVVLHRCGADFYFLIVCSWRGNNEIWETVFAIDKGDDGFHDWPRPGPHLPTFCVWEMGAVAHESLAWSRYLHSARDDAARKAWMADQYEGLV